MRQFIAFAEAGHMSRAAEAIGVTHPTLSAMLKKLEEEVGSPLLDRTGRGVRLTDAGRAFLEHAEASVRSAEQAIDAVRELRGLSRGVIRVGGGATAVAHLLPAVAGAVRAEHPGLRLVMREAGSSQVASAVLAGELDLGVVTLPVDVPGHGDLMTVGEAQDELRLIVPGGHALAGRKAFRWSDLEDEPVVAFEAGSAVRLVIDRAAAAFGVSLDVVMELRSIESIQKMVEAGIGVGFVSRLALEAGVGTGAEPGEGLACRDGRLTRQLGVVRRRDRMPSDAAAAFERALLDRLGSIAAVD
ncbi:MAG: LysR family transcriptional regulator [Planctomycetota bacterium]